MKKKVSVIIPVYETQDYLKQCLESVINQTLKDIEILCIYKESKDNSFAILSSFKDSRIKIINQNDGGLGGARNLGLDNSKGKYIFFLDSDDWILPDTLENLVEKIEKDKSDFVIFPFYSFDDKTKNIIKNAWGSKLPFNNKLLNQPFTYKDLNPKELISENSLVVAWNKLYDYNFIQKNKLRFPENIRYEDNPFYYEAIIKAKAISLYDKKLLYYRINRSESLQSSDYDNKNVIDIVYIMYLIELIFKQNKISDNNWYQYQNYKLSEFIWRFKLMKNNRLSYLREIKKYNDSQFWAEFCKQINYKTNIKIHKKPQNIKISIIIPVYNVEKYIDKCLESLINQTLEELEFIFIDDCSNDNSSKIIENYCLYDERIKVLFNDKNMGAGYSRNKGLEIAKGEYISFLDPDDLYYENTTLEEFYNKAKKNKAQAICGNIGVIEENYQYNDNIIPYKGYNIKTEGFFYYKDYNVWSSWGFTRFIYQKKAIDNLRFPSYRNYEDPIFLTQALIKINKIYGLNKIMYLYRQVPKKRIITYQYINDTLSSMKELFYLFEDNNLKTNYTNEYQNLINFIIENIIPYLKQKKNNYLEIKNTTNEILMSINKDMIVKSNYPIYNNLNDFKISIITRVKSKIKRILKMS